MARRWVAFAFVFFVALGALGASSTEAQHSGGSFGGSHFGGGSHGSSGRGSFGGGGFGGRGGRGFGYPSAGSRDFSGSSGAGAFLVLVLALFVIGVTADARRATGAAPGPMSPRWNGVDMVRVRIALDWRARRRMQALLDGLGRRGHGGKRALHASLHAVVRALKDERISWLYASIDDFRPTSPPIAEARFRAMAIEARATYEDELVRGHDGETTTRAGSYEVREHEGEGVVLITILVASKEEIVDVGASNTPAVDRVLHALDRLGEAGLVALEIAWTPAHENDRMSTATLEVRHPGLAKLTSIGGRRFCAHCRGPYAQELAACPHCGAPHEPPIQGEPSSPS